MNVERMQIYTPMSLIFCTVITKVTFCFRVIYLLELDTRAACNREGTSVLVQLGPELEINLRGAPYELVPGYFVNSLLVLDRCDQRRPRRACAFAQSHQRLAAH